MAVVVQKYGGSSLATLERIQHVAQQVFSAHQAGLQVVVVVSAMHGETDRLLSMARSLNDDASARELDVLLSTGEQVSSALLVMALHALGCSARSMSGLSIPVITDEAHQQARIRDIDIAPVQAALMKEEVVVIAGFQGVSAEGQMTTIGRGGSDTTAVALAAALNASECQIFTDVDGVYTADPHLIPEAKRLEHVSFNAMLELASSGAKVVQTRAAELARRKQVPLRVLSSFQERRKAGTLVSENELEKADVMGLASSHDIAYFSLKGVVSIEAVQKILNKLIDHQIDMDCVSQYCHSLHEIDLAFIVTKRYYQQALSDLNAAVSQGLACGISSNVNAAKLSIIGVGMRSHTKITQNVWQALALAGIAVKLLVSSEIKVSLVVDDKDLGCAIRVLHEALGLARRCSSRQEKDKEGAVEF